MTKRTSNSKMITMLLTILLMLGLLYKSINSSHAATRTVLMKQNEGFDEHGIQIRAGDPVTPSASALWYNVSSGLLKYSTTGTPIGGSSGSSVEAFATKSGGYQVLNTDYNILVTATAGGLPASGLPITAFAASGNTGKQFCVKKIDSGSVPVDVQAAEGFDSQGTHFYITAPNAANCFKSNGAAFFVF